MEMPGDATPTPASAGKPRGSRLKSILPVLAVAVGMGSYWYVFPDGILNAAVGVTPSRGTSACLAFAASPLCYVFGWSTAESAAAPFDVKYRKARIQALAAEYGITSEISISGGPQLGEEEDRAGYLKWLGHTSEADFEQMLADLDAELGMQALAAEFPGEGVGR